MRHRTRRCMINRLPFIKTRQSAGYNGMDATSMNSSIPYLLQKFCILISVSVDQDIDAVSVRIFSCRPGWMQLMGQLYRGWV